MRILVKKIRQLCAISLFLFLVLFAIKVFNANNVSFNFETMKPFYFMAKNLKSNKNESLRISGSFKKQNKFSTIIKVDNVSSEVSEKTKDNTDWRTRQRAMMIRHWEGFGPSAPRNKTRVSFSPLYKISERITSLQKQFSFFSKQRQDQEHVNCKLLFDDDVKEVVRANRLSKLHPQSFQGNGFINQTRDCAAFVSSRGYIMDPLTEEERDFPIAYSIMTYKNPEQFEILLRAIYRPQNVYCIHVDKKTNYTVYKEFASIVRCFPNVFLASKRIEVYWGSMSVLTQDLICMQDLLKFKKWKYFINLTGQEFPLRTNYELVKILKIYNGANDLEGLIKRALKDRWQRAGPAPHQIRPVKGAVHITVNRQFVEYAINDPVAKDFLKWNQKVSVPDETFFASLNYNPHLRVPGSYKGDPETDNIKKPFLSRFKNWRDWPCFGHYVRGICIFGIGDLPLLARRPEFFANKFFLENQTFPLQCMEELIFNRTRDEYLHQLDFITDYYENLEFIKNVI